VRAAPGTALVIDDEAKVRQLVRRMLDPEVCRVLEAPDGETGLRLIEQNRDSIDVVLTDLLMPGIDGYHLIEVLSEHCPDLPVACMSGLGRHGFIGRRIPVPFIAKPFGIEMLRRTIEPLLKRSQAIRQAVWAGGLRAAGERTTRRALQGGATVAQGVEIDLVAAAIELRLRRAEGAPKR
jgi:DNA-binding NtrC family response regulator